MRNLEFWTHKSTRQPKPWAISPQKKLGKTLEGRGTALFYIVLLYLGVADWCLQTIWTSYNVLLHRAPSPTRGFKHPQTIWIISRFIVNSDISKSKCLLCYHLTHQKWLATWILQGVISSSFIFKCWLVVKIGGLLSKDSPMKGINDHLEICIKQ